MGSYQLNNGKGPKYCISLNILKATLALLTDNKRTEIRNSDCDPRESHSGGMLKSMPICSYLPSKLKKFCSNQCFSK